MRLTQFPKAFGFRELVTADVGHDEKKMNGKSENTGGQHDPFRMQKNVLKYGCIGVCVFALLIGIESFHVIGVRGVAIETLFVSLVVAAWFMHGTAKIKQAEANYRNKKKDMKANN